MKIGVQLNAEKEILDVVYCLDENYNLQMITSANSFLNNYTDPVRIHILHSNPDSLSETSYLLENFKNLISIDKYKFTKSEDFIFPAIENYHVTEATYYRLFLQDYLPKNIKNLLYLDPDVITMNKVTEVVQDQFTELSTSKFSLAAVNFTNSINLNNKEMLDRLKMKSTKYFNAGVLFIDYKKWTYHKIGFNLLIHSKSLITEAELKQHDQDILNSYFDGEFLELEHYFNYVILERFFNKDREVIERASLFIHYIGNEKPWLLNGVFSNIAKYYQESFEQIYSKKHIVFDKNQTFRSTIKNIIKFYPKEKGKINILLQIIKQYFNKV